MGRFDHLIPAGGAGSNRFSHLIPQAAPQAMTEAPSLADLIGGTLAQPTASPLAPVSGLGLPELAQIDHGLAAMPPVAEPRLADPMQEAIRVSRRPEGPVAMETAPALFNPTADTAMGDLLAGYLGLKQIPGAMQVAGGAKQLQRAQDITRAMELANEMGFEMSPEDAAAAVDRETGLMERGSGMISEALPGIMDLNRRVGEIPLNPAAAKSMQADTWGQSLSAAMEDPAGVARTFGLRSLAPSAPTAIAAVLGSMGGPLGAAAAAGSVSGGTDYAMTIAQDIAPLIASAGVDPNDPRAVEMFFRANPEAAAGMIQDAAEGGGIIGAFDAASGGVGGLLAKWAAAGAGGRKVAATAGNVLADPTLGGAGEAVRGGSPGDVLAEIVGGAAIGGPTELGQIAVEALKQPGQEMPSGQSAPDRSGIGAGPRLGEQQAPDLGALLDQFMQQQPQAPAPIAPAPVITKETPLETAPPPSLPPVLPDQPVVPSEPPLSAEPIADVAPEEVDQDAIAAQERQDEAPLPQKRPFTNMLRAAGIFIDPDTPGGKDLARVDVTSRTHPGLIKRGNGNDLDNIPASEHPEIAAIVGEDRGYLDRQGLIDAIRNETRGAAQEAVATARREWEQMQAEAKGRIAARPPLAAITIPDFVHPEQDIDTGPVRSENIRRAVNQAYNAGAPIAPDERIRIIEHLDKNGGSVEYAIEREIIRSVLNAEAGEPVEVDQFPSAPLPGFDEGPVGAAVPGAVGTGRPELERLRADGGEEGPGQDRLAGEGRPAGDVDGSRPDRPVSGRAGGAEAEPSRSGEGEAVARPTGRDDRERARGGTEEGGAIDLTPEGRQQVIPGAERITDRERAERAQQAPKRGGNRPMGDDSLFGDPGNRGDLFDEPKRAPAGETATETAARLRAEEEAKDDADAASRKRPRPATPEEAKARFDEMAADPNRLNLKPVDTAPAPADDEATPLTEAGVKEPGPSGSTPASPPKPLDDDNARWWASLSPDQRREIEERNALFAPYRELMRLYESAVDAGRGLPYEEKKRAVRAEMDRVSDAMWEAWSDMDLGAMPEWAVEAAQKKLSEVRGLKKDEPLRLREDDRTNRLNREYALKNLGWTDEDAEQPGNAPPIQGYAWASDDQADAPIGQMIRTYRGILVERTGPEIRTFDDNGKSFGTAMGKDVEGRGPSEAEINAFIDAELDRGKPKALPKPKPNTTEEVGDTTGRKPRGRLSPKFLDFSFTERPSVYGAAFRAAGYEPGEAQSFPVEKQLRILKEVIKDTYGIEVTLPEIKVRSKNLVGRMVTKARPAIEPIKAVDQLLDAYRNLQMLASILGVPPKALALEINGEPLTLSLTSRKRMGPLGMFSWGADGRAIHLPGRSNSFAHEWGHALDHYLGAVSGVQIGEKLLSRAMDDQGVAPPLTPRRATVEAFAGVMRALYGDHAKLSALILELQRVASEIGKDGKPTKDALRAAGIMHDIRNGKRPPAGYLGRYFASSAEYDKLYAGGTGYFEDPAEMFARAFEAWVGNTVSAISDLPQGFMSKSGWAYQTDQDPRLAMTFPKGADALQFSVALTELSNAMSRSALFGADAPATRPEDVDIFSDKAMLMRLPKKGPVASARQELQESARSMRATLTGIGDAYRGVSDTASKVWFGYLTSLTATMHAVANRQEGKAAETAFRNIADMMGNDPGAGRLIKHTYQQDMEVMAKRSLRKLDFALDAYSHGRQFTDEESKTLRSLLTGGKVQATPEMKELAGRLRAILKGIWYELQKAGIEVSYADEYLPRISNKEEIATDPMAFMKDGAKVYGIMFQKEVIENDDPETQIKDINAVVRGLRKARMPTPEGETVPASRLSEDDEELLTNWREARRTLSRLQNQAEKDPLNTKIGDKIVAAEAEVERLTELALDMLKERFSDYSAENWYTRMMVGDANDFDTMGPNASFLKGRTLPPEADAILTRWLQHDPIELIAGYTFSAARRAEYAKRFGASGEKLENMLAAAVKDGATGHDVSLVRRAVNSAAGRFRHPDPGGEQLSAHLLFLGTLAMLGRATFASLGEPMAAGLRTGNVADSGRALTAAVGAMVRGGHRADLFELSKVIGLTTSAMRETVMANRLSADSAGLTKGMSLTMAKWFNRSLLTPLTNFQMASMMPAAHSVIMRHLRTFTKGGRGKTFANAELNELGIAPEEREDLLQWLDGLKGMPKPEDLLAPDGSFYNQAADLWATATVRLVNQIIQNPQKSDRPIMANHPMVAAVYGIMSFTMAFHRNILVRNVRRMARTEGISNKTLLAANVMASIGALFAGQFLATVVREALFNKDMWQEKEEEGDLYPWLLQRAFSRTGLTGAFDPLIQIARGIKYSRDIAAAAAGPHLGFFLQNAQTILSTVQGRNSPNTNTAEWNAARAFYQMAIQPAFMVATTKLPGGILSAPATSAIWWGSSPQASAAFADMMAGEKMKDGETYKKRGQATPWWEMGD